MHCENATCDARWVYYIQHLILSRLLLRINSGNLAIDEPQVSLGQLVKFFETILHLA